MLWQDWRGYEFNTLEDAIEHEKNLIETDDEILVEVLNDHLEIGESTILSWLKDHEEMWKQFSKDFEVEIEQAKKYYMEGYVADCWEEEEI